MHARRVDSIEEDQTGTLMPCRSMFYMYYVRDVKSLSFRKNVSWRKIYS